ncbi:MAG: GNAT family N-acetyltransferase [Phocaeicola vulgatus]
METTVNSSTYAIPFYQSLGFAVVGEKQNYHGLCSTPMRRYHAVFVQKQQVHTTYLANRRRSFISSRTE